MLGKNCIMQLMKVGEWQARVCLKNCTMQSVRTESQTGMFLGTWWGTEERRKHGRGTDDN